MSSLAEAGKTGVAGTEVERIEKYRREELERAGYSKIHARIISERHTGPDAIDLHKAVELVEQGADPHVAADILI